MVRRWGPLIVVAVGLVLGFVSLPVAGASDPPGAHLLAQAQVVVPDVKRKTVAEAENALRPLGLRIQVLGQTPTNDRTLVGRVERQTPFPGVRVAQGRTVQVFVFSLAQMVVVPDLRGRAFGAAVQALRQQFLGLRMVGQAPTTDPAQIDRIATQSPSPGARVIQGTVVGVRVYRLAVAPPPPPAARPAVQPPQPQPPAGQVIVPSVVGRPLATARGDLRQVGLTGQMVGEVDTRERARAGQVASQTPPPGTRVPPGSVVYLRVFRLR